MSVIDYHISLSLTTSLLDMVCDNIGNELSLSLLVDPLVSSIHGSVVLELG